MSGACVGGYETMMGPVYHLTVLPNGYFASIITGRVVIWNSITFEKVKILERDTCLGYRCLDQCLAVIPGNRLAVGSFDDCLIIWNTDTWEKIKELECYRHPACLIYLPNGYLASGENYDIVLWDIVEYKPVQALKGHSHWLTSLAVLPNTNLASGSNDGTIRLWDIDKFECIYTFNLGSLRIDCLVVLYNGYLASGLDDKTIKIWDIDAKTEVATLKGHTSDIRSLVVLPNHHLVSGLSDGTMIMWDVQNLKQIFGLSGHCSSINSLVVLPSGLLGSASSDWAIGVWDLNQPVGNIPFYPHQILFDEQIETLFPAETTESIDLSYFDIPLWMLFRIQGKCPKLNRLIGASESKTIAFNKMLKQHSVVMVAWLKKSQVPISYDLRYQFLEFLESMTYYK